MPTQIPLREKLSRIASTGAPTISGFAAWVLDHMSDVAFNSVRGLAHKAEVNPNTVTRLARELGYDGFDAFRADVQQAFRQQTIYAARAQALLNRPGADIFSEMVQANRLNAEHLYTNEMLSLLETCIDPLLQARRIYSVGVRSCYSIAHYFTYVGSMAFPNFVEVPSLPGAIMDQISLSGPEDILVAITFEHYSTEVVRACQIAHECGTRVLALTDTHMSPIAAGAWRVVPLPMGGPQIVPSLSSAFAVVEMLLAGMASRSDMAARNINAFESRIAQFGGYQRG